MIKRNEDKTLRHIRPFLDTQTANMIACSLAGSRLDYCNSLIAGTTAHNIARLQRVQNNAVKVVCRDSRHASPKPLLQRMPWLSVKQRVHYKVGVLTFTRAVAKLLFVHSQPSHRL